MSPGARLGIVDEVGALQVESAGAEVTDFDRGFRTELLFKRDAPLLDVLRRRVELNPGEAHDGRAQDRRRWEVERRDAGHEGVSATSAETPRARCGVDCTGVHVDRSVEDSAGDVGHHAEGGHVLCNAEPRDKAREVRVHQASRVSVLSADEDLRRAFAEVEIAVCIVNVDQWAHVFVAKAVVQRGVAGEPPGILRKAVGVPLWRFICGMPACPCRAAGRPSRKLANADPVAPSFRAYSVVKPLVYW